MPTKTPELSSTFLPAAEPLSITGQETGPSQRRPLHLRAYEEVKRLIVSGEFPADTFLSERQLAERLGMSKTPVHVALKRLEAEGYVLISPQQGIVVRGLVAADILDHYEIREALETYVARRLTGRLEPVHKAALEESLRAQDEAVRRRDLATYVDLDASFHLLTASFLGNREITEAMERLADKIRLVTVHVFARHRPRFAQSSAEHRRIAELLAEGDADATEVAVKEHLDAGKRWVLSPTDRLDSLL